MSSPHEHGPHHDTVAAIEATLQEVFASVSLIRDSVEHVWSEQTDGVSRDGLGALREVVATMLEKIPHVGGGGFVAELDAVDPAHRFWEWWMRGGATDSLRRLHLPTDSPDATGYAYESMGWFREARAGRQTAFGPFVDFAGVDQLVILCAMPVMHRGQFVGVAGADLVVAQFEPVVIGHLRTASEPVVLISDVGRVIASTSADLVPGERFAGTADAGVPIDAGRAQWKLHAVHA